MNILLLFILAQIINCSAEPKNDVSACVTKIIQNFYAYRTKITFVDIKFNEAENLLKEVSLLYHVSIESRTTVNLKNTGKGGIVVAAGSVQEFINEFPNLQREPGWCPRRKYLIIIDNLAREDLVSIFHTLLKLCVINVVVIDNARDPILFTYNPFENYACGERFDRVIEMGDCLGPLGDIYFYKYVTGLKNCTFRASSAHWPPYSIDTAIVKGPPGVEEYIIQVIAQREQFNIVHYNYSNDAENFSTVSKNLSTVGPLMVIQEKKEDMMFGGMLLTNSRAAVFDFIWVHLPHDDDIRILVKAATDVDSWRNFYLEFSLTVWLILVSAFLAYYAMMLVLIKPKDKGTLCLKMFDYFFQHGSRVVVNSKIKVAIIFWIWFAFLISSIYQSSLIGLVTNPSKNYQVENEDDIIKYNLKPCVSPLMAKYFGSVEDDVDLVDHGNFDQCGSLMTSIKTVSKSENLYTYTLYVFYSYYKYNFCDEYGKPEIYAFKHPTNKVIYAIYLYKGFPMTDRLQNLFLRLRENGITTHYMRRLMDEQEKNFYFMEPLRKSQVIVPWYILIIGSIISTVVFIIELNRKPSTSRTFVNMSLSIK